MQSDDQTSGLDKLKEIQDPDVRSECGSKNETLFSDYIDTFRALIDEFLNNESGGEFMWLPKTNYLVSQAVRKYLPLIYAGRALIMGSRNEETKEWGTKVLRTTITEDEYK